jgi:hypothetical protein
MGVTGRAGTSLDELARSLTAEKSRHQQQSDGVAPVDPPSHRCTVRLCNLCGLRGDSLGVAKRQACHRAESRFLHPHRGRQRGLA